MGAKRVYLTLNEELMDDLNRWAEIESRPLANMVTVLVERAIKQAKTDGVLPRQPIHQSGDSDRDRIILGYLFGENAEDCKRPTSLQIEQFCSDRGLKVEAVAKQIEARDKEEQCVE